MQPTKTIKPLAVGWPIFSTSYPVDRAASL
jgi:hypothetical protein